MKSYSFYVIAIICFFSLTLFAQQFFTAKNYPKNFGNPVKIPISLAGNFGECRPNHFHSGLDVRTNKVENIPVFSIGDGYISRVKIEEKGFGNAIYVNHNNGYTSLYAHLNLFYPELEQYVRAQQYKNKSWKIDLQFLPHQFPIRKGSFIAFSGNTGSSQAPHLHMEIRNTKTEKPLNGLLFYDYADSKAPILKRLGIYNTALSIYEQAPTQVALSKAALYYKPAKDTLLVGASEIGLSIQADDPMEGALGVLGVYEMNLYVDGKAHFAWQLDNIGYDETRYMNAMADYRTKRNGGPWLQLCFKLPNDHLEIYKSLQKGDGRVDLSDGNAHLLKLVCKDVKGNAANCQFYVRSTLNAKERAASKYLFAGQKNKYKDEFIAVEMDKQILYDKVPAWFSVEPNASNFYSHFYNVLKGDVPAHDTFGLQLKLKSLPNAALQSKLAVVKLPFAKETNKKAWAANYKNGWVSLAVKEFGKFEIVVDQLAPVISTAIKDNADLSKSKRISFTVKEETTSVREVQALLDGKWIRIVQKGNLFYYEIDQYCARGAHTLVFSVEDENNNKSSKTLQFVY